MSIRESFELRGEQRGRAEGTILRDLGLLQKKIRKGKSYEICLDELEIEDKDYFEALWTLIQNYSELSTEELLNKYRKRISS